MVAAVNRVTTLAVLFHRGVFPYSWAALVGMTIEAELLGVIGLNHTFTEAAVGRVAGRATDFTLKDRVMRAFVCFNLDVTVTAETDLRFVGLLSAADMKVMAGVAGNIISFVDTHIP